MSESKDQREFVLNASDVMPIKVGPDPLTNGLAPETIFDVLKKTCAERGDQVAYKACTQMADKDAGKFFTSSSDQEYTWNSFYGKSMSFARSLVKQGFTPFSAVNMIGFNSPEWVIADMGCMMAEGLAAGIYATNNAEASCYVSQHSKAEFVLVEGEGQLAKFIDIIKNNLDGGIPTLKSLIVYNMSPEDVEKHKNGFFKDHQVNIYEFNEFLALGAEDESTKIEVEQRMAHVKPGNCCMLIYTSGTTGNPKAVMISHDNATWTGKMLSLHIDGLHPTDRIISYLPLSHIAAQILDVICPIIAGACVTFARPDALKGTITMTLAAVKPTIFFGVPRVWEKIMAKIKAAGAGSKGLKKSLVTWAKGVAAAYSDSRQGFNTSGVSNFKTAASPCGYSCADCLVLSKVKGSKFFLLSFFATIFFFIFCFPSSAAFNMYSSERILKLTRLFFSFVLLPLLSSPLLSLSLSLSLPLSPPVLGLTDARVLITGAAPIAKECLDFFAALDLPIMEVYGQSECTGPATCTSPSVGWKAGTVGPVIPGTTMRIGKNEEIQYTGRHIFMGYMGMEQKSKDTLTEDGWLASGDQGKFDEDQFLSITGRIKELIIGAGGENIAPVVVEKVLKKHMTFLSNVVVFGDNKPYLGIMVSLEVVPDPASGLPTDELTPGVKTWAASIGSDATTYSAAKTCEKINAAVEAALKSAIAAKEKGMVSSAAQPKFHIWLPEELTNMGEAPTLTATLKLKRKAVMELYADVVEKGYVDQTAKFAKK